MNTSKLTLVYLENDDEAARIVTPLKVALQQIGNGSVQSCTVRFAPPGLTSPKSKGARIGELSLPVKAFPVFQRADPIVLVVTPTNERFTGNILWLLNHCAPFATILAAQFDEHQTALFAGQTPDTHFLNSENNESADGIWTNLTRLQKLVLCSTAMDITLPSRISN